MKKDNPFKVDLTNVSKEKIYYTLAMFPYPSGAGLHVGHAMNFTANDIIARYKRMQGFSVVNAIGWDSFGLPTEGYAMKVGKPANEVTQENISNFIAQCELMDWSYDRDREFATSSPEYYKWTQWIFQQLFKAGLVYRKEAFVNRCPQDQTVLANDQVVDGKCERCGTEVTQKKHMQRFIKITDYAEKLINDLDMVDRPEETKIQQKYRIGKSEGAEIDFKIKGADDKTNVLVLHGLHDDAKTGWRGRLADMCELNGISCYSPQLDHDSGISLDKDLETVISQYGDKINENTIIIGYSLGGLTAKHLLTRLGVKIKKLVTVGSSFSRPVSGESAKEADLIAYRDAFLDHDMFNSLAGEHIAYFSKDDPVIPYALVIPYFEKYYPTCRTISFPNKGHFNKHFGVTQIDELLADIGIHNNITVFTTRPDTIYGVTAIVLAPENEIIDSLLNTVDKKKLEEYRKTTGKKTALERQQDAEERSGLFSGIYATHPLTQEQVPVRYADYVLPDYATGAVMFVPAHDERDRAFAKKHGLAIKQVIKPIVGTPTGDALINKTSGYAIIFDPKTEKYLCVVSGNLEDGYTTKSNTAVSFPGGGIDEGEKIIDGTLREIQEETGYTNVQLADSYVFEMQAFYFTKGKNEHRDNHAHFFYGVLSSDENVGQKLTPTEAGYETQWFSKDELIKMGLHPIRDVALGAMFGAYTGAGSLIHSGDFNGTANEDAKKTIIDHLEKNGLGKRKVTYKLRDWSVSRQRYWGSPIPVYYDEAGNPQLIPEDELPVILPLDLGNYKPAGKSPLADHPTFPHYTPANAKVPLFRYDDPIWGVKEGVETKTRTVVQAIIKDKNSGKYLMLKWKVDNTLGFVIGGVEDGEDYIRALKREIAEEAGFAECEVKHQIGGETHRHLYHALKGMNQYTKAYTYYVEVDATKQVAIDPEELEKHQPLWLTVEEALAGNTDPDIEYQFDLLLGKKTTPPARADKYNEYFPQPTYLRECDTLDTFMCSSFYYLRFLDPKNEKELISKDLAEKALPVDFYIGGKEHTYGHLLYSRFIHKFLFDQGILPTAEPFKKLIHQGFVLGPDGRKMSKRWGNVINPSEVADEFGSDTTRTYTMFMGPIEQEKIWNPTAVTGVKKFLERAERLEQFITADAPAMDSSLHKTIKGVTEDIERLKFNTVVSKLMVFVNDVYEKKQITTAQLSVFLQLLAPFATKLSQQMREKLGNKGNIHFSERPLFDSSKMAQDSIDLPVQMNGKMKGTIEIAAGTSQDEVMSMMKADERFASQLEGKEIAKIIYVQDKIINLIIK